MDIAQCHRNVRLRSSAGNVIAGPSDSYGELERVGNVFTEFGIASDIKIYGSQY